MTAYCMKCRKEIEVKNPKIVTMRNGKPATQGACLECGTTVYRVGKSWKHLIPDDPHTYRF